MAVHRVLLPPFSFIFNSLLQKDSLSRLVLHFQQLIPLRLKTELNHLAPAAKGGKQQFNTKFLH